MGSWKQIHFRTNSHQQKKTTINLRSRSQMIDWRTLGWGKFFPLGEGVTELPGYQSERRKLFESQDSVNTSSPGEVNLSLAMNAEVLLGAFIQAPPLKTSVAILTEGLWPSIKEEDKISEFLSSPLRIWVAVIVVGMGEGGRAVCLER